MIAHSVQVGQGQVGQGGRELAGSVEFRTVAHPHAATAIEQEIDVLILVALELLREQLVVPGTAIPIDVS